MFGLFRDQIVNALQAYLSYGGSNQLDPAGWIIQPAADIIRNERMRKQEECSGFHTLMVVPATFRPAMCGSS